MSDKIAVIADHLCVKVGRCTCDGPFDAVPDVDHRDGCGYEPIATVAETGRALALAGFAVTQLPDDGHCTKCGRPFDANIREVIIDPPDPVKLIDDTWKSLPDIRVDHPNGPIRWDWELGRWVDDTRVASESSGSGES